MSLHETTEPACETCVDAAGVALVIEGRPRSLGGIDVARLLPVRQRRAVGPFVFLDHMGPASLPPGSGFDVLPHPHIGLSTVTYLFEGEEVHRDSMGNVQTIRPGELNVMTAGRGVVHSERTDAAARARGGTLHGLQLWLALPVANEDDDPSFAHHEGADLPWVERPGARAHVLFGTVLGATSKAVHPTMPHLVDVTLDEGASFESARPGEESAVYVVEGEVAVAERVFGPMRLLVAAPDAMIARRPSRIVVLGGPPLHGKRLMDWNFVSSSRERIDAARAAWVERRFPPIPGDDVEFVPLPG